MEAEKVGAHLSGHEFGDHLKDIIRGEWFDEDAYYAKSRCLREGLRRSLPSHQDYLQLALLIANAFDYLEARGIRKIEIDNRKTKTPAHDLPQPFAPAFHRDNLVTARFEHNLESLTHRGLIVDNQNTKWLRHSLREHSFHPRAQ